MYKAILFDVDDVLIRSKRFGDYFQEQTGVGAEEMLPFFKGIFRDCQAGKADLKVELTPWLKKWGYVGDADSFMREWFEFENRPDQKLLKLVKKLRDQGVKCYLATNQEKYRGDFIWEKMNFKNYFDGRFTSAEMKVSKPSKDFFEKIITELSKQKIEPKEILFIDNEAVAVNSAASLGISGHVYTKYHRLFIFLNQSRMKILTIISVVVVLLVLSFIPFFTKSLMMGGEIKINFWQKYFMHID